MAKAAIIVGSNGVCLFASGNFMFFGGNTNSTLSTEANAQIACTEAATFSRIRARVQSGNSGTASFRFRDAGADGNGLAQVTGTGLAQDTTNTDVLSAGGLFNFGYTDTGTDSTAQLWAVNIEMSSGYGCIHTAGHGNTGLVYDSQNNTRYIGLTGDLLADGNATESQVHWRNRGYTSWEAIQVGVTANARTNDSTVRNRINAADGTGSIVIGAGVTGLLQDTTIGDALAASDNINFSLQLLSGVEDLTINRFSATLKSTLTKQDTIAIVQSAARVRNASATADYFPIGGSIIAAGNTDANTRMRPSYAGTASNIRTNLSANSYGANGTMKLVKNGTAVITLTITTGTTGWLENTSDTDTFDDDDEYSLEYDDGTSGSISLRCHGLTLAPSSAFDAATMAAMHQNYPGILMQPKVVASGMTPPEFMPN